MAEYLTKYPKTVSFLDGLKKVVNVDSSSSVEQLHIVVKKNAQELINIFKQEGFTRVKFEHKQPDQIGNGLSLKLKKPWEIHVRFSDMKKGLIAIHAEVEISRDYKIKKYVQTVFDNYRIKLVTPNIPVFAWKPMLFVIGTVGAMYLWKYIDTVF